MKLAEWLSEQPFSLSMSSGFFGFFVHAGLVAALEERNLVPRRISGSSAGALVGTCWAAGLDAAAIRNTLFQVERQHFWDPQFGLGLLRGELFGGLLKTILPVKLFSECRIALSVSAWEVGSRMTKVLDDGELVSAVRASCAVPLMFHPVKIGNAYYLDGGLADRPGVASVKADERLLYHHLEPRSLWRGKYGLDASIPQRPNMVTLMMKKMPSVSPWRMEIGEKAFYLAYKKAKTALETELPGTPMLVVP